MGKKFKFFFALTEVISTDGKTRRERFVVMPWPVGLFLCLQRHFCVIKG
jgi:hypothetical protein